MITKNAGLPIATYASHQEAEDAIKELQRLGFDMKKVSIIGKDYRLEEHVIGFLNAGDRARIYGKLGAFWGGLLGILFGSALLFVPVVGHIVVLGPLAAMLFSGLEGAVLAGGASALVGALSSLGIPKDSVLRYQTALQAEHFILVVHGDTGSGERAKSLLTSSGYLSFEHHVPSGKPTLSAPLEQIN